MAMWLALAFGLTGLVAGIRWLRRRRRSERTYTRADWIRDACDPGVDVELLAWRFGKIVRHRSTMVIDQCPNWPHVFECDNWTLRVETTGSYSPVVSTVAEKRLVLRPFSVGQCCGCDGHAMEQRERRWWCFTCNAWQTGCAQ